VAGRALRILHLRIRAPQCRFSRVASRRTQTHMRLPALFDQFVSALQPREFATAVPQSGLPGIPELLAAWGTLKGGDSGEADWRVVRSGMATNRFPCPQPHVGLSAFAGVVRATRRRCLGAEGMQPIEYCIVVGDRHGEGDPPTAIWGSRLTEFIETMAAFGAPPSKRWGAFGVP
jgi:hypothetical protein